MRLRFHRWWLSLAGALLTPWIGPHVDRYLPLGKLLFQARGESADAGFWILAAGLVAVAYGFWFGLLSVVARLTTGRGKLGVPSARDERR
jgi:hypothetical protein